MRAGTPASGVNAEREKRPSAGQELPALSIIIPAMNEASFIEACLDAISASTGVQGEVIVVANGCTDDTAARAAGRAKALAGAGFTLDVVETEARGKPCALNTGDGRARYATRVYLDADVEVSPQLLPALAKALACAEPTLASGTPVLQPAKSAVSRAYGRFWMRLPFFATGCPAFGLYAVNAAGRARWGAFPPVIADDLFVRLLFRPDERIRLPETYRWPLVEGFRALVRVRRRQDRGVAELAAQYPELLANDETHRPTLGWLLQQAFADPVGFAVYAAVRGAARIAMRRQREWARGR